MANKYTIIRTTKNGRYQLCEVFLAPEHGCFSVKTASGVAVWLKTMATFPTKDEADKALEAVGGPKGRLITD